jgi:hypothetical protein
MLIVGLEQDLRKRAAKMHWQASETNGGATGRAAWGALASPAPWWIYWVVAIGTCILAVTLGFPGGEMIGDVQWYRLLAQGRMESVIQPYASRQLEPRLVLVLTRLVHIRVERGFALVALVSTLICAGGVTYILYRERVPLSALLATAPLPVWASIDHGYLLPDAFFAGLLTVFLLFLWRKSYGLAATVLFPLYIARESTLVVLLCFVVAGITFLRPRAIVGAVAASVAGAFAGQYLARHCQPNVHHLAGPLYMLAKVPFNFLGNILGVQLWVNTLNLTNRPLWTWRVPACLHLGGIKLIGISSFGGYLPLWNLMTWMGAFGVLPLLLYRSLVGDQPEAVRTNLFLRFCVYYGVISYLAGPLLGGSFYRLVLYGWPAFLIALPLIWPKRSQSQLGLILANLACGWTSFATMVLERPGGLIARWVGLAIMLLCWIFAWVKSDVRLSPSPGA